MQNCKFKLNLHFHRARDLEIHSNPTPPVVCSRVGHVCPSALFLTHKSGRMLGRHKSRPVRWAGSKLDLTLLSARSINLYSNSYLEMWNLTGACNPSWEAAGGTYVFSFMYILFFKKFGKQELFEKNIFSVLCLIVTFFFLQI